MRPVPQEETHAWYYKTGQEPIVWKLTGLRGEPTIIVLLIGQSIKLLPKIRISLPKDHCYSQASSENVLCAFRELCEKGMKRLKESEVRDDWSETVSSGYERTVAFMNSKTL